VLGHWGRVALIGVALLSSLTLVGRASAQGEGRSDDEARALFDAGEIAFDEGRYENALDYFRRSYTLSHRSGLLYNIGVCAERLRHDAEAIEAFEQYLAAVPDAPNRASVQARIRILREGSHSRSGGGGSASTRGPDTGALVLTIASGAVVVAGIGCLIAGALYRAQVEQAEVGTTWAEIKSAYEQSGPLTIAGIVGVSAGAAALVAGIVWLAIGTGGSTEVALAPGGVQVRGWF
jgi:tetratricopeptide (TPR) repeat protein